MAIDAEFVCVQQEESSISYSGSKEIISEPRNALGRLSIIDCRNDEVIIDDYILPQEPVVDYLTRFSGINPIDLDANNSPHHLVSPQEAYLKVRLVSNDVLVSVFFEDSEKYHLLTKHKMKMPSLKCSSWRGAASLWAMA